MRGLPCEHRGRPRPVLWSLARSVNGWGRIHTVERLKGTENQEIQEWLVREGYRNAVMYEYLAYLAATSGHLLERLSADPDDGLLDSGELLGLGPEFTAESALDAILQDLGRVPGHGWHLVSVGLRSPVIRVRNMAVKALNEWPRGPWPEDALPALQAAARREPDKQVRTWMNEVLAGGRRRSGF